MITGTTSERASRCATPATFSVALSTVKHICATHFFAPMFEAIILLHRISSAGSYLRRSMLRRILPMCQHNTQRLVEIAHRLVTFTSHDLGVLQLINSKTLARLMSGTLSKINCILNCRDITTYKVRYDISSHKVH